MASAMGDFLLGDRWVRPSRNLVERAAVESAEQPAAVQVERKVMEVLVCLARSPGRVVTKDELVREVWDGRFVSDDVVWRSVRELRRALGDETRAPRYIETIPRRGYRLLAAVAKIPESAGAATARTAAEEAEEPDQPTSVTIAADAAAPASGLLPAAAAPLAALPRTTLLLRRPRRLAAAGAAVALALFTALALAAAWWLGARRPAGPAGHAGYPGPAPVRLAVLPLANLSGDAGQEYFADGLTEELIARLGSLRPGRLAVVGRTSIMALKGHAGDAAEAAHRGDGLVRAAGAVEHPPEIGGGAQRQRLERGSAAQARRRRRSPRWRPAPPPTPPPTLGPRAAASPAGGWRGSPAWPRRLPEAPTCRLMPSPLSRSMREIRRPPSLPCNAPSPRATPWW
jgi:transcriptional activator of cad operon